MAHSGNFSNILLKKQVFSIKFYSDFAYLLTTVAGNSQKMGSKVINSLWAKNFGQKIKLLAHSKSHKLSKTYPLPFLSHYGTKICKIWVIFLKTVDFFMKFSKTSHYGPLLSKNWSMKYFLICNFERPLECPASIFGNSTYGKLDQKNNHELK